MKISIKRGLALAAVAGASCATGLLAPAAAATAAPGDPSHYFLESVSNPEKVLTALPYGPISLVPRGATPGQVWDLMPSDRGGVNLVNRDSGECLTVAAPFPGAPVVGAPCGERPGQDWRTGGDAGDIVRFESFTGCLISDYGRVSTGACYDVTAQWRLVEAP